MKGANHRDRMLVWGLSNNRAGTEGVIAAYIKNAGNIPCDFLCYDEPLNYPELFPEAGHNRYFVIPVKIEHPVAYTRALRQFMREHGHEYSTLWFNVNDVSNIDLLIYAEKYGIERRITHIHSSRIPNRLVTKVFSRLNWRRCQNLTTDRWACSEGAARYLYDGKDCRIIPNRVDAEGVSFLEAGRRSVRKRLGIEDSFVIGTVGRLAEVKNQKHIIRLLPEILQIKPNAVFVLLGQGSLESDLAEQANRLGVRERVLFAGSQKNVQDYLSAFDVFAFPSLFEGLSLSMLEAQFNGLPCVISEDIDSDSIISRNVVQVPLRDVDGWVRALTTACRESDALIDGRADRYDLAKIGTEAIEMFRN